MPSLHENLNAKRYFWVILTILGLGILLWISRYANSQGFGLYEDDFTIVPQAIQLSWVDLAEFISDYIIELRGHNRPLSNSSIFLFAKLGWEVGGLQGIYFFGWLIVFFNTILFFMLLLRLYSYAFALIGSIIFVLFTADTTQAFLTHSLGLFPSLAVFLIAAHLYLSNWKVIAYLVLAIILFSYETTYLLFLAVPLLDVSKNWDRGTLKEFVVNGFLVFLLLFIVYLLRSYLGDDRVGDLSLTLLLRTSITHMIVGSAVAMFTGILRPFETLVTLDPWSIAPGILAGFVFFFILSWINPVAPFDWSEIRRCFRVGMIELKNGWSQILEKIRACPAESRQFLKILITGLFLLILSYPLTFTTRSFTIYGRGTRVHFAAVVGFSILWTTVIIVLLQISDKIGKRRLVSTLLAFFLGLWLSFSLDVQRDYTVAWTLQQDFWKELVPLIDDVEDGTVILIKPDGLLDTTHIDANTWNLPRILNQMYRFPDEWEAVPRVYRLVPGWERNLLNRDGEFDLFNLTVDAPPSTYGSIESENVILIESIGSQLIRSSELSLAGKTYALKQESNVGLFNLGEGFLLELLVRNGGVNPSG